MFILVVLFIMMSVYVGQNKKVDDNVKTGWFVFLAIVLVLIVLLELL